MKASVLIVEDDRTLREELAGALSDAEYDTCTAESAEAALQRVVDRSFDLCISDIRLPGKSGIELIRELGELCPETEAIIITAYAETRTAIEALRAGAADYVLKPFILSDFLAKTQRLLEHRRMALELRHLRRRVSLSAGEHGMVGNSTAMAEVKQLVEKVARTQSSVIITGPSGTGKELAARAIHRASDQCQEPFVPINCAAIPETLLESELFGYVKGAFTGADTAKEGLLQAARNGTVFLDEVAELPLPLQAKLLRVLESRELQPLGSVRRLPMRARIITATNRTLEDEIVAGSFREDLYYRISVMEIRMPGLCERREDIPALVEHLIRRLNQRLGRRFVGATNEAMQLLMGFQWKGNVRELENVLERAMIISDGTIITPDELPAAIRAAPSVSLSSCLNLRQAVREFERSYASRVLDLCEGDKPRAAELLGLSLSSLYRKLNDMEVDNGGRRHR